MQGALCSRCDWAGAVLGYTRRRSLLGLCLLCSALHFAHVVPRCRRRPRNNPNFPTPTAAPQPPLRRRRPPRHAPAPNEDFSRSALANNPPTQLIPPRHRRQLPSLTTAAVDDTNVYRIRCTTLRRGFDQHWVLHPIARNRLN